MDRREMATGKRPTSLHVGVAFVPAVLKERAPEAIETLQNCLFEMEIHGLSVRIDDRLPPLGFYVGYEPPEST